MQGITPPDFAVSTAKVPEVQFPDLYEASILELQQGLDAGHFSSVDLVKVRATYISCHIALTDIAFYV